MWFFLNWGREYPTATIQGCPQKSLRRSLLFVASHHLTSCRLYTGEFRMSGGEAPPSTPHSMLVLCLIPQALSLKWSMWLAWLRVDQKSEYDLRRVCLGPFKAYFRRAFHLFMCSTVPHLKQWNVSQYNRTKHIFWHSSWLCFALYVTLFFVHKSGQAPYGFWKPGTMKSWDITWIRDVLLINCPSCQGINGAILGGKAESYSQI